MSNARVEAAEDALRELWNEAEPATVEMETAAVLAAADAVMFSDEAVERAARARYEAEGGDWDAARAYDKAEWVFDVRAVIAALKGEQ